MSTSQTGRQAVSRRRWLVVAIIGAAVIAVVAGVFLVWFLFFSSEAPPAPTLQDALSGLGSLVPAE